MSNRFDFEVAGKDAASDVLKQVSDRVDELDKHLEKTREKLKLGGTPSQEAVEGLNERFERMARSARDNVQYIGDMVPPLKNVTALVTRYGSLAMRLGGVGAVGYAMVKGAQAVGEAAKSAYNLDVAAKNAGLSVDEFTRISGAMQILGVDADTANQSVEGLYKGLNDALQHRNSGALGLLTQIGVHLEKTKDGTVDMKRALEDLTRIFPTVNPQTQKTLSDMLGFTDADLRLLREGAHYKELLAKSDRYGLTVDPKTNKELTAVNQSLNEISASWEGLKKKTEYRILDGLLSDGSVRDGLEGINDILTHGLDSISLAHVLGATRGNEADELREIYNTPELYNSLSTGDKVGVNFGVMTQGTRQKYKQWHRPVDKAEQLRADLDAALHAPDSGIVQPGIPYNEPVTKNTRGMRNNNPGNLTAAPNSSGKDGRFNIFDTQRDGIAAFFRQMMLDGDRGMPTLRTEIKKYAPKNENPTEAYIQDVARRTGINSDIPLDLHNPQTLLRIAPAVFRFENGFQPFSPEQINQGYLDAVTDPRWSGKRNREFLQKQRDMLVADNAPARQPQPASGSVQQPDHQSMTQAVAEGVTRGMSESRLQVEMVNPYTGEPVSVPARTGRVVTAMNQY
ncbi:TPA: hypothetical protein I8Y21_003891 [Klebsiella oxytoca]|uniref:Uncharacterized protein n=1 Tax=Klebsiella oxytoca TaxID=571 RepID=A0AAN5LAC0_KLEOX|nr:hypothetical protein [Klebsiella oxytoca]